MWLFCGAVCKIEGLAAKRLKLLHEAIRQALLNDSIPINGMKQGGVMQENAFRSRKGT